MNSPRRYTGSRTIAGPQKVRVHFDSHGNADLQYDSCCEKLGARVRAKLG